jgi:hypothetical protein
MYIFGSMYACIQRERHTDAETDIDTDTDTDTSTHTHTHQHLGDSNGGAELPVCEVNSEKSVP